MQHRECATRSGRSKTSSVSLRASSHLRTSTYGNTPRLFWKNDFVGRAGLLISLRLASSLCLAKNGLTIRWERPKMAGAPIPAPG